MSMTGFFLIWVLAFVARPIYAAQHVVGDSSGWTLFSDYQRTWVPSNTFYVGDTFWAVFNYNSSSHGVITLSKSDIDNCATSNAINSYTGGKTVIKLTQRGPMYFACPKHCSSAMKLIINVISQSPNIPVTTKPSGSSNSSLPPSTTTSSTPPSSKPTHDASSANSQNMMVVGFSLILAPLFEVYF